MAIYSLGVRTTDATIAHDCLEIFTAATDRAAILEIGISIVAATASVFGLGRPADKGITPTAPVTLLAEDSGSPAGTVQTALAWATQPTVPTAFLRRVSLPATIGAGIIWTFPRGLIIPISFSIVVWNITAVSLADIWVVVDE
jgi:hypothetical protein